jgi:hypothetical protein
MHISREMQSCQILQANEEVLDELVQISRSFNVPMVTMIVPTDGTADMAALGWEYSAGYQVMYRER